MNDLDQAVMWSVICLLIGMIHSIIMQRQKLNKIVPQLSIIASFVILMLSVFAEDKLLFKSFVFGIISGTIIQPLLADPYLTKKTLNYKQEGFRILSTPYWMCLLWGVAITHILYLFLRCDVVFGETQKVDAVCWIIGVAYFLTFELITNNLTHWWGRRNCKEIYNVAIYAFVAEIGTIGVIRDSAMVLSSHHLQWKCILWVASITGLLIVFLFRLFCFIFYEEKNAPSIN